MLYLKKVKNLRGKKRLLYVYTSRLITFFLLQIKKLEKYVDLIVNLCNTVTSLVKSGEYDKRRIKGFKNASVDPMCNQCINEGNMIEGRYGNKSRLILINGLICLLPLVYFMAINPFEYIFQVYARTIIQTLLFIGIISLCAILWKKIKYFLGFLTIAFCVLDFIVLHCTLFPEGLIIPIGTVLIIQALILYLSHKNALFPLYFTIVFCLFFNLGKYVYLNINKIVSNNVVSYGKMAYKPNIYFLILESYQGNEALKKLYNYDNEDFLNALKGRGFFVYDNIFSIVPKTRYSLSSVFGISDLEKIPKNLIDQLLVDSHKSPVTSTLLDNGYGIEYIFPTYYFGSIDSECRVDENYFSLFFRNFSVNDKKKFCFPRRFKFKDFIDDVEYRINTTWDKPTIFITKIGGSEDAEYHMPHKISYSGGLFHIPGVHTKSGDISVIPKLRKKYINELKNENLSLITLIDKIQKKDPDSLIVLMGDHGAQFFSVYKSSADYFKKNKQGKMDFILDYYNVLLAIKWPKYVYPEKDQINVLPELFKVIFENLIPETNIPQPSSQLYDHKPLPLKNTFLERKK